MHNITLDWDTEIKELESWSYKYLGVQEWELNIKERKNYERSAIAE